MGSLDVLLLERDLGCFLDVGVLLDGWLVVNLIYILVGNLLGRAAPLKTALTLPKFLDVFGPIG